MTLPTLPDPWDTPIDAPLPLGPTPMHRHPVADGTHRGVRWWIEDVDGLRWVTACCADPSVFRQECVAGAGADVACGLVDGALDRRVRVVA